jgi:hypothetical protein
VPILVIVNFALAISLAVHAVRTGRNMYWIMILLMAPLLGSLIYIGAELMPELMGGYKARKAGEAARRALDPGRDARRAMDQLEVARTPANLKAAADALLALDRPAEALALYEEATSGAFADDPALLAGRARAAFEAGNADRALASLDKLRQLEPNARMPEEHLLYARVLEVVGRDADAEREYRAVAAYYPGAEALARQGLLLDRLGRRAEAEACWDKILAGARIAPRFARKAQREWIDMARAQIEGPR